MKFPELPFNKEDLKDLLSRVFSFSRREVMIIAVSAASLIGAALVVIIISLAAGGGAETAAAKENYTGSNVAAENKIIKKPFLSDFILHEDILEESFTGIIYSREPAQSWSEEMVEKYWIDPKEIAKDQLEKDAEKIIRDIFADVP